MGKRSSLFRCHDCHNRWWEYFEWLHREELIDFARNMRCPQCESKHWELTDASEFGGGQVRTHDKTLLSKSRRKPEP